MKGGVRGRTVSAGPPDPDVALLDKPVDLLHKNEVSVLVLCSEGSHGDEWRDEWAVGYGVVHCCLVTV